MRHLLKTVEPYFTDVSNGVKNFELRQYSAQRCDKCKGTGQDLFYTYRFLRCSNCKGTGCTPARDFAVGDILTLECGSEPGRPAVERTVIYILKDTDPCMEGRMMPGYCILGLAP